MLDRKAVLVAGADSPLGEAVSRAFVEAGARVALSGCSASELARTAQAGYRQPSKA